jgi:hypothetical protein
MYLSYDLLLGGPYGSDDYSGMSTACFTFDSYLSPVVAEEMDSASIFISLRYEHSSTKILVYLEEIWLTFMRKQTRAEAVRNPIMIELCILHAQ